MNGRASKRIRLASAICRRSVRALKREYRALPYHRRAKVRAKPNGVARTHREVLWRHHGFRI
jgi:hypothetical protein